jgi:hypothetical protein
LVDNSHTNLKDSFTLIFAVFVASKKGGGFGTNFARRKKA